MKGFVVAGTSTGVGKTTLTAALLAALRGRGLQVQPFKCGPDYIDPSHHAALAGRPSYNLDTWMLPVAVNRSIFRRAMLNADVAVVEGVMGLFDGVNGSSEEGSTAEIAKLLGLPVVLVVDASNAARSVGAIVKGFQTFDPEIRLLGVVLNGAAGPVHADLLRDAIAPLGVAVLGWFPKITEAALKERHLGLITAGEKTWSEQQVELLIRAAESHLDLDCLLASCELKADEERLEPVLLTSAADPVHIGIARDRAFSFYYQSSLDALCAAGAVLVEVSPLVDKELPATLDGLYLGGGYPEIYAAELSQNRSFLNSVREFVKSGRTVYAECGGLMYLADDLTTLDGQRHTMAAVLPISVEMLNRLEQFGYTEVQVLDDCPIASRGTQLRGHSFHYSRVTRSGNVRCVYRTRRLLGAAEAYEGYCSGNVLASYIHCNFAGNPDAAVRFVQQCRATRAVAQ